MAYYFLTGERQVLQTALEYLAYISRRGPQAATDFFVLRSLQTGREEETPLSFRRVRQMRLWICLGITPILHRKYRHR